MWPFDALFPPQNNPTSYEDAMNTPFGQGGSLSGPEAQWSPRLQQLYNEQLNQALWGGRIDQDTYNILENRIHNAVGSPDQFDVMMNTAFDRFAGNQSLGRMRETATRGLDEYEGRMRPYLEGQVGRYDRIFGKPGQKGLGLRSDAEFANFLSGAQNSINADINATRIAASKGNASRGVQQSGKVTDQLQRAQFLGREQQLGAERGAFQVAQQGRDTAYGQLGDFLTDLNQRRIANESALQSGQLAFAPLGQQRFSQGVGTSADLRALDIGNDRANIGLLVQSLLGFGNLANQGMGQASSMIGQFMPGGR